jgi:hypothetical protein
MLTNHSLNFEALKSRLHIPADRVLGSTTDLPAKMLGLFYLESRAQHLSRMTGLNCYVPKFVCIRAGEKLAGELPPVTVREGNVGLLREPFGVKPAAQQLLTETLRDGYFLARLELNLASGLIIRSAGKFEDGKVNSYAGVYQSLEAPAHAQEDEFVKTGQQVVMSPYAAAALRYHYFNGTPTQPIDVIAQELVGNSVALNFTVTSKSIESIEILGDYSRRVFIPGKEGRPGKLVDPASGQEIDWDRKLQRVMEQLHERVARAFCAEAAGNSRISIECAFDRSHIDSASCPNELALLQIRPLPDPLANTVVVEDRSAVPAEAEALFPIHTHLIAGPCTFDSVILCKQRAMASHELATELLAVINRLRDNQLFRPIVVLEDQLTGLSCMTRGYILETIANLPFVGVIDQGWHISRSRSDTEASIFAGHVGALTSEKLRFLGNAHSFMSDLYRHADLEEIDEDITPTEFESLLSADLDHDTFWGGLIYRCTEVYRPSAPVTIEVIDDPEADTRDPWDRDGKQSKLKLTGELRPQQDDGTNASDDLDDQAEWY